MRDPLSKKITGIAPSGIRKFFDIVSEMPDAISLGVGEPDFDTPWRVREEGIYTLEKGRTFYTSNAGLKELRQEISNYLDRKIHVRYDYVHEVMVTVGGSEGIDLTMRAMLNPGDEVLVPEPSYVSYAPCVTLADGVPVPIPMKEENEFKLTAEELEAAITPKTKILVLPFPNNPTGAVWSRETIRAIGEWAVEHHVWVISDEIYEHLNYDDAKTAYVGVEVPECRDQLLVLNGVAKTYAMPGWRVGWMVAPAPVAKAVAKLQGHLSSNVSNVPQRAALAAVAGSLDEVHMMRESFDARRKAIVAALNDIPGVHCPTPTGAFYAFPDVTGLLGKPLGENGTVVNTSSELAAALLDEAHVAAVPGEAFGAPGYLRFSYALADDQLAEGMRRFRRWVG